MRASDVRNNNISNSINLLTALFFSMFVAYKIYLMIVNPSDGAVRVMEIIPFLLIAVASFLGLISHKVFRLIRTVLLIAGVSLDFIIKLVDMITINGGLAFDNTPAALSSTIFLFSQLAELILLIYLVFSHNEKLRSKRILAILLMSLVILLYLSCFGMECVLRMHYRLNIDLNVRATVLSRFLYFLGFAGIAVSYMLPVPSSSSSEEAEDRKKDEDDFKFSIPERESHAAASERMVVIGDDLVFSPRQNDKPHSKKKNKNRKKAPSSSVIDDELVL